MRDWRIPMLILLCVPLVALAQDEVPSQGTPPDDETLTVDVEVVQLILTVTDDEGRYLTGLTEEDFVVYEDGVPQEILTFDAQTELPLTVVLAMDTSSSVREKLDFEQRAATEFFFQVIQRRRDRGMLVTFDSAVQVLQDFTDSPELLSEAVRDIRVGGSSAMYDAIYLAIDLKVAHVSEGRRVMVVISDGDDNSSDKTLEEALQMAQQNDVVIYTISTNETANFGARRQQRGDDRLEQLAGETGGRVFYPFELEELAESLEEVTEALRMQYEITYVSSNPARDGSYRKISVRPLDRRNRVSTRDGYYASTD